MGTFYYINLIKLPPQSPITFCYKLRVHLSRITQHYILSTHLQRCLYPKSFECLRDFLLEITIQWIRLFTFIWHISNCGTRVYPDFFFCTDTKNEKLLWLLNAELFLNGDYFEYVSTISSASSNFAVWEKNICRINLCMQFLEKFTFL